ncbi:MAG TPA: CPBP family intramembrane glutamic endopeptidase [Candidatus Deferrimicrobium sp.]|nr:CPBP family intramembrane glutamic endopeptidase [Candidatus Deferrimicrobium sp.]
MTPEDDGVRPDGAPDADARAADGAPDADARAADGGPPALPPARPGLSTFTIEGRAAPGLFVVGWLASILGAGILFIGYQAPRSAIASALILVGLVLLSVGLVTAAGSQAIERRAGGVAPYTGPSPFLLLGASVAVGSLAASLIALLILLLGGDPEGPLVAVILLAVVQATYIGLTHLLVVGTGALSWAEMGVRGDVRERVSNLAWGAWFALPVLGLTMVVVALLSTVVKAVPESPLPATGTTEGLLLNLLGGAVLVPIGEEVMFRGVATTAWRRVYGPSRAIVQGALFFAVVHILQVVGSTSDQALGLALVAFAARVPVALALGWLFEARRSIFSSIGLHMAYNAILLVLAEVVRTSSSSA